MAFSRSLPAQAHFLCLWKGHVSICLFQIGRVGVLSEWYLIWGSPSSTLVADSTVEVMFKMLLA